MVETDELLQAIATLEQSPDYRVFSRLKPRRHYRDVPPNTPIYRGAVIDLETTSADTDTAEVIEIGVVRFTFDANGVVYAIDDEFSALSQPSAPLDPVITEITGITDEELKGQMISLTRLDEIMNGVDLVIAYGAGFDRRIAERNFPGRFDKLAWACAHVQVPWTKYGCVGGKLEHVIAASRLFYDAHRALADCQATLHVLATMERREGDDYPTTPMAELLSTTRGGAVRVLANGSSFSVKDRLKSRGYKWAGKVPWFIDVASAEQAEAEIAWLQEKRYSTSPSTVKIPARHRFSKREDELMWPIDGGY